MLKRKSYGILSSDIFVLPVGILISFLFVFLDYTRGTQFLRGAISFVAEPIYYNANRLGNGFSSYLETFARLGEFKKEYNDMSLKIYEYEVANAYYFALLEENRALRSQVKFSNKESEYVEAKVMQDSSVDLIRINKGRRDGVNVGNPVLVGNLYVGTVVAVDESGSMVRLPLSKSSSLEVVLVEGDWEVLKDLKKTSIISKAVAVGSAEGVQVQNINNNSNVKNGDVVLVNDEKIGEVLVLGQLVNLSTNPAEVSKSGFVDMPFDYDSLITVFVKI